MIKPLILVFGLWATIGAASVMQMSGGAVVVSGGNASASITSSRQRGGVELFLDVENIETIAGATQSVNKPAKYGSAAIFGDDATDTWDDDKRTSGIFKYGDGDWRMWYQGNPDEFHATNQITYLCYAVSTNGINWTRPTVGLTSYNGSTTNNIVSPAAVARDTGWIVSTNVSGSFGSISFGNFYWSSTTGTNWSQGPDVTPTGESYVTWGSTDFFLMRKSNTWRTYSQLYLDSKRVGGIAYGGANITNTYTPRAIAMPGAGSSSTSDQRYFWRVKYHAGNWLGFVSEFSQASNMLHLDLYFSRDGFSWAEVSDAWIPNGGGAAWDSKMIFGGKNLIREGNTWRYYYDGSDVLHNVSEDFNIQIGLATIGYERIGQVGTTGTVVMRPITPTGGLLINTDASGGTLKAALFNANTGVVMTGYDYTDFDTISSDTYSTAGTWGGLSIPQGTPVRVGFTLSSATLYSYSAGVPVSQVIE